MERFEGFLSMLDYTINSKRKQHIAGGVLMSVSLLFGSLAITVMTLKMEDTNERYIE